MAGWIRHLFESAGKDSLFLWERARPFLLAVAFSLTSKFIMCRSGVGVGVGEATFHALSYMKPKRCSHNLQSDQQWSCQRICVLIMRITSKTIDQRS